MAKCRECLAKSRTDRSIQLSNITHTPCCTWKYNKRRAGIAEMELNWLNCEKFLSQYNQMLRLVGIAREFRFVFLPLEWNFSSVTKFLPFALPLGLLLSRFFFFFLAYWKCFWSLVLKTCKALATGAQFRLIALKIDLLFNCIWCTFRDVSAHLPCLCHFNVGPKKKSEKRKKTFTLPCCINALHVRADNWINWLLISFASGENV